MNRNRSHLRLAALDDVEFVETPPRVVTDAEKVRLLQARARRSARRLAAIGVIMPPLPASPTLLPTALSAAPDDQF